MKQKRIGVFVCHCGLNIAGSVDVEKVVAGIKKYPGVVHAENYIYMCSDPGQRIVRNAIREYNLNGLVMSNCSPSLHERTYRNLASTEGINPYFCEIANIREQCSWPHAHDKETATAKAMTIIKTTIERLKNNMSLTPMVVPLTKRVLIVGGGIAGMQAALDIADGGYEVVLVEKSPFIGGHMAQLSGTFPTLESVPVLLRSLMDKVSRHRLIKLHTSAEIGKVSGYVGNFQVNLKKKPTFIESAKCTACGVCLSKCPVTVSSEYDRGLSTRAAIYRIGNNNQPVIDAGCCNQLNGGHCFKCSESCETKAINFKQQEQSLDENVGAIVVATGYDLFPRDGISEYESDPDIIDGLQFERILSPNGPTRGKIRRPSDGKIPKEIVFIQCVGSRDPEHGVPYCSRVCCIYTAKQALLYKKEVPDGQTYIFYMDIRSDVKGCEEFVKRTVDETGVLYLRGRVSRAFRDGDSLRVWGVDTLTGKNVEIAADMVVLATAMIPSPDSKNLARSLNIISDANGFISEAHIKLRPVETLTSGIYLAGTAQWPRDIPDTISSASGAASKILSLFSRTELLHAPTVAQVDIEVCSGCGQCAAVCAYKAINIDEKKKVAAVNEALCEGCGACAATCPSKAIKHKNWTPGQFMDMLDAATAEYVL